MTTRTTEERGDTTDPIGLDMALEALLVAWEESVVTAEAAGRVVYGVAHAGGLWYYGPECVPDLVNDYTGITNGRAATSLEVAVKRATALNRGEVTR